MATTGKTDRRRGSCPLCGQAPQAGFNPFCSQGCRDRDLLNWLGDAYRVPGAQAGPEELPEGLDSEAGAPL
jgi:endogenous inhibitor of DNA gyrase (YacG/DUF329 family)